MIVSFESILMNAKLYVFSSNCKWTLWLSNNKYFYRFASVLVSKYQYMQFQVIELDFKIWKKNTGLGVFFNILKNFTK